MSAPPAAELLAALAAVLRARRCRWYLFGAQAVTVWGEPRMSADVDVTVEIELEDVGELVAALEAAGFVLRIREVEEFVARTRVLPLLHRETGVPLDVILAGSGLEELFLDRAREVALAGTTIPVISPEDLMVTKILAGRPRDLDDVLGVVREQGEALKLEQVRTTLEQLERALDRSDLRPVLEQTLHRAGGG